MNAMTNSPHTSKSILARALATENIRVEHSPSAATAMFDVANRVLVLPVWKEMSEELHDMFIGHEVAHALFTPYRESDKKVEGGWCSDAERIGGNFFASYVQGIINIVEDVRIEKLIKEKYPGLRRDFVVGYNELEKKDFFGTSGKNLADFSFGDRINIHFKCGAAMNVPFSAEETELVNLIDSCETFDDVISASESVYNHICGQRADMEKDNTPINVTPNPNQNNDDANSATNTVRVQSNDGEKGEKSNNGNTESKKSNQEETPKNNDNNAIGNNDAGSGLAPNDLPKMTTQKNFDEKRKNLNDTRCGNTNYYTLGVANTKNIILPHAKSNAILSAHFDKMKSNRAFAPLMNVIEGNFEELMRSTNPLIQVLVKQFEMKKAADIQKRTSISRSGKIDADRIFKYKVSDDIFLRCAKIAEGKNHGLVLFVDWSASMFNATSDTLNQIIILTRFCKQMNIPFEVYLFSSQYPVLFNHLNIDPTNEDAWGKMNQWKDNCRVLTKTHSKHGSSDSFTGSNEHFALINVLSSQMNKRQFNDALRNVFILGQMISRPKNTLESDALRFVRSYIPDNFGQGNTPLDSTIMAAMTIVPEFQKQTKVQIVNTIFLTDGESGNSPFYSGGYHSKNYVKTQFNSKEYIADDETPTDTLLRIFRDVTGSNTIGFFVCSSNHCRYFNDSTQDRKTLRDNGFIEATKMKNASPDYNSYNSNTGKYDKMLQTKNHGYDRLFILPCNQEIADDMEFLDNLDDNASLVKIRNAFTKSVEKRGASRSFLNRFADVIANPVTR
jgi:hypothetical protein